MNYEYKRQELKEQELKLVNRKRLEITGVKKLENLNPLEFLVQTNLGVLLPVGLGIMGTMIGISLIPRIVYKFL